MNFHSKNDWLSGSADGHRTAPSASMTNFPSSGLMSRPVGASPLCLIIVACRPTRPPFTFFAFLVAALESRLWKTRSQNVTSAPSLTVFIKRPKNQLFIRAAQWSPSFQKLYGLILLFYLRTQSSPLQRRYLIGPVALIQIGNSYQSWFVQSLHSYQLWEKPS